MSARFYCPDPPSQGKYRLDADEARHLSQVCRLAVNDDVELFDGRGQATRAKIVEVARNWVDLVAFGDLSVELAPPIALTLATAVPKGDRFDWLVDKATELGISRLIPIQTKRSVVEPKGTKIDRLRRAVIESSKQCGRDRLMALDELTPWAKVSATEPDSLRLIAHPDGRSYREWPPIFQGTPVLLAIGPEGGFTDEEVDAAISSGWSAVSLGRHILRVETAGIVGCSAILARIMAQEAG